MIDCSEGLRSLRVDTAWSLPKTPLSILSVLQAYTYWNYLAKGRGRNGWRIDFFLVTHPPHRAKSPT